MKIGYARVSGEHPRLKTGTPIRCAEARAV